MLYSRAARSSLAGASLKVELLSDVATPAVLYVLQISLVVMNLVDISAGYLH